DQRKQDMARVEDASVKEEGGPACVTATNSITSNIVSTTSANANGGSPSPREDRNLSSIKSSPRNISDDDTVTAGRPVHHTLPGSFLSGR
ncbi:putative RING/FYVE/PHD zinc finger protein, partial [Trifolium medium]|nr:putative RING/FYVE/PHD zinc finger protein [Trifolium medium]